MMPPSISSAGIVPADRPDQRPLPNARSRMPFQSGLTVSGVAAFMPAVLAADWTVLELAAPILAGQILNLGAHRVIDVVIPQPFLHDVAGLETKFFTVL